MKTLDKIPTGKIERASNLLKAGAKVGVNYLKYYGNKITKDEDEAKKIQRRPAKKVTKTRDRKSVV